MHYSDCECGPRYSREQKKEYARIRGRVEDAFEGLEDQGIMCRPNYLCCTGCASGGIFTEMEDSDKDWRGGVYWHEQDDEGLMRSGYLYLGSGAFEDDDEKTVAIGEEIVEALEDEGLEVEWDGTASEKIRVEG